MCIKETWTLPSENFPKKEYIESLMIKFKLKIYSSWLWTKIGLAKQLYIYTETSVYGLSYFQEMKLK